MNNNNNKKYSLKTEISTSLVQGRLSIIIPKLDLRCSLWASDVKLSLAIGGAQTPVLLIHGLAIVTDAVGLPGLIKGLKVEEIDTPGEHAADTRLPERLRILGASLGGLIVRTTIYQYPSVSKLGGDLKQPEKEWQPTCGPASFTVDDSDLVGVVTSNLLNVLHRTRHVIKVGLVGLIDHSTLPVGECVGQHVGNEWGSLGVGREKVIGSTIGKLIPTIGSTDGDALELVGDETNVVVERWTCLVAAVESLRANGDGLNYILITGHGFLQSGKVLLE